jgi:hypothetical protein
VRYKRQRNLWSDARDANQALANWVLLHDRHDLLVELSDLIAEVLEGLEHELDRYRQPIRMLERRCAHRIAEYFRKSSTPECHEPSSQPALDVDCNRPASFDQQCTSTDNLPSVARLLAAQMDRREFVVLQLASIDLLIIDDFALEPMSRDESRDIYQLIVERTGRAPTIVTSNRDTAEWLAAFDETLLAQSAVDRFIHNAYDLVVEGASYRARLKPKLSDDDPPPSSPNAKKQPIGKRR